LTLQQRRTACNRDCPDACGIIATVDDDRIVRLQGDPDHPITRGFLCHRTSRFLERHYDPERLTSPLIRRGSALVPTSWPEALDFIADTMLRIRAESGGAAILHYRCGGSLGLMKHITDYFFERFGPVTIKSGDICSGAGEAAQLADFGQCDSHDIFDLLNSKTIVIWGKNLYTSSVHLLPIVRAARHNGTRVFLIDPVYHRTVGVCDTFLQPRPGGDIALALGVARWLFGHGCTDPAAATYCDHFAEFESLAMSRTVAAWSRLADVPPRRVALLAASYAEGPSAILVGWGLQRRTFGATTVRALDALAAISGNLGIPGGGISFYYRRRGAFDLDFVRGEAVAPRTIPEPLLGRGILDASDPPVRMVWVTAANPVAMLPDSHSVARALETRELTVVVDSFLSDSALRAHVVLPTTTMLEEDDLVGSYGHHWLADVRPVAPAAASVKSDYDIVQALAPRVGLGDEFSADVSTWKTRLLRRVAHQGASLEDLQRGPVRNPLAQQLLFADRRFPTPTGRVNLIHQIPPESLTPAPPDSLMAMAFSTEKTQGSQWRRKQQLGPAVARVHPESAQGFRDGELVKIVSATGELVVRLAFDDRQRRGVVLMDKGGWLSAGRCANVLVAAQVTDAGECAVYYDTPVHLQRASES
jgi:anaerobic selenocysteine-containing dehydrogenase